jgi:hypothetical protein
MKNEEMKLTKRRCRQVSLPQLGVEALEGENTHNITTQPQGTRVPLATLLAAASFHFPWWAALEYVPHVPPYGYGRRHHAIYVEYRRVTELQLEHGYFFEYRFFLFSSSFLPFFFFSTVPHSAISTPKLIGREGELSVLYHHGIGEVLV